MDSVAETRRGDLWSCLAAVKIHFSSVNNIKSYVHILIHCWGGDMRFQINSEGSEGPDGVMRGRVKL